MKTITFAKGVGQFQEHSDNECINHGHHGQDITVTLRNIKGVVGDHLVYTVELRHSLFYSNNEGFSRDRLYELHIPAFGSCARTAASLLSRPGQTFKIEIYRDNLAINGLLWDGRWIHIKDIAA